MGMKSAALGKNYSEASNIFVLETLVNVRRSDLGRLGF